MVEKYLPKKYISFDVEASGLIPGKYSMLSIGACVVGDISKQFYKELKPINKNYSFENLRIGSLGLNCLKEFKSFSNCNPEYSNFTPELVLDLLSEVGEEPKKVMSDYANWVLENTQGFKAVEAAAPIKFDGMFSTWYFGNFYDGENPFGFSGEDINSFYRGVTKNINANVRDLNLRNEDGLSHNALDDAIQQAREFEVVLKLAGC